MIAGNTKQGSICDSHAVYRGAHRLLCRLCHHHDTEMIPDLVSGCVSVVAGIRDTGLKMKCATPDLRPMRATVVVKHVIGIFACE